MMAALKFDMSVTTAVAMVVSVVIMSVRVSDSASVPISSPTITVPSSTVSAATLPTTTVMAATNDDVDLALLASSKILMDHTSSSSTNTFSTSTSKASLKLLPSSSTLRGGSFQQKKNDEDEDERLAKTNVVVHEKDVVPSSVSASSGSDSTLSSEENSNSRKVSAQQKPQQQEEQREEQQQQQFVYSSGGKKHQNERNSYEMSSPLHVARCRATCLQKFNTEAQSRPLLLAKLLDSRTSTSTEEYTSSEEMHLLPLLRLRKRRSSSEKKSTWSCQEESSDCLTCWRSCELFEPRDSNTNTNNNKNKEDMVVVEAEEAPSHSSSTSAGLFPREGTNEASSSTSSSNDQVEKEEGKSKQSSSSCSTIDRKQCLGGCEVACSFYEHFSAHHTTGGESNEKSGEQDKRSFNKGDPVIATKHESVVKIVPGKITWPLPSPKIGKEQSIPVVYVVIQEYPDRKWRQIAQTTEASIDIPTELTSAMSAKLRSVRVLAVGPEGLLSVYSPETVTTTVQDKDGKGVKITTSSSTTLTLSEEAENNDGEVTGKSTQERSSSSSNIGSSSSDNINDHHLSTDPVDPTIATAAASSTTPTETSTSQSQSASGIVLGGVWHTPSINNGLHVEGPFSFELRVVSLIHQKSLVIAELQWDEIGGNPPRQEYLITWELSGGGLKGHLVTDSTSVTLSLWPDTTYQIQVEQFLLNLDSDGEQPAPSSTSLKSLPLIVDTSEAAYPMEKPSALLSLNAENDGVGSSITEEEEEDDAEEDDYENEDVSFQEGNETVKEEENHKSFTGGFLNMTLLLAIAISALIFVLVILSVAAFTWTKMRKLSSSENNAFFNDSCSSPMITPTKHYSNEAGYYSPTHSSHSHTMKNSEGYCSSSSAMEPEPLLSQEGDFCWEEYCHVPSPVYYTTTAPSNNFSLYSPYEKRGFSGPTVSVISTPESNLSREPPPCSYLSYFRGAESRSNGCSSGSSAVVSSSNMAYSLLNDAATTASGKLGCPSRFSNGLP